MPDTQLIRLCDRMVRNQAVRNEAFATVEDPDSDPVWGPRMAKLNEEWSDLMPRLFALKPTTPDGFKALAQAIHTNRDPALATPTQPAWHPWGYPSEAEAMPDAAVELAIRLASWLAADRVAQV